MPQPVTAGAMLQCSFGVAPSPLSVVDPVRPTIESKPAGVITDMVPITNIAPFGMCSSLANPTVAAATSAALGVLTPQPCVPNTPAPWAPGSILVTIGGRKGITNNCKLTCAWGGVISVVQPNAFTTTVT